MIIFPTRLNFRFRFSNICLHPASVRLGQTNQFRQAGSL